jgi:methyl-accepting chemotaxis protein
MGFSGLRIGTRLALALAPPIVLLLATALTGLVRLSSLNDEFTRIVVDRHSTTELLNVITGENHAILRSAQNVLISGEASEVGAEIARIAASKSALGGLLERLDRAFHAEGRQAKDLLQSVHTRHATYLVDLVRFTRLIEAGKPEEARAMLNARLKGELHASLAALRNLSAFQTRAMRESVAAAEESYRDARDLTFAVVAVSVALAVAIALASARAIARPLREAVEVAERVAAGNLASRIEPRGRDEAGMLMSALSAMNSKLADIVRDVRGGSDTVAAASRQLVRANDDLSLRCGEQAAALNHAAGALDGITRSSVMNAESARRASALAASVSETATRGERAVDEMIATIGSICASSRKVTEIVSFLDRVSFQTHLLALNAAVEAARAGEAGRGFAVVAEEVRDLASRSAAAAKDIRELIADAAAEIEQGTQLADVAGRTMRDILAGARDVAELMGAISGASQDQRIGIEEVNGMLARIEVTTRQNTAVVGQVAAAMRMLEGETRGLVDRVSIFELGEESGARELEAGALAFQALSAFPVAVAEVLPARA